MQSLKEVSENTQFAVEKNNGEVKEFSSEDQINSALSSDTRGDIKNVAVPGFDRFFPRVLLAIPQPSDNARIKRALLGDVKQGLLYCVFIAVLMFANIPGLQLDHGTRMLAVLLLFLFGIAPIINSGCEWLEYRKERSPEEWEQKRAEEILFASWTQSYSRLPIFAFVGVLIVMFLLQVFHNGMLSSQGSGLFSNYSRVLYDSAMDAGLRRHAIRSNDEWWRLISTGLLHGGMIHLYFNSSALLSISSLLVGVCRSSWIAIVFTLSVVGGSLASIYGPVRLGPSVGASGGVMGLLGFVLVLSFFYKGGFPHFFKGAIIRSVILIAILGWLGKNFIDNSAHAGGFLVGVVLGFLVIPFSDRLLGKNRTPTYIYPLAAASGVYLLYGAIKAVQALYSS